MTLQQIQTAFRDKIRVMIKGSDSYFEGIIVVYFPKRSGAFRCVVENDDGILHIFNINQLELIP